MTVPMIRALVIFLMEMLLLRRRWEITDSFGVTRVPLHVIPGEGPVSTSCSAGLGKGVDAGPSPGMTA
jgi:hypothetical protein